MKGTLYVPAPLNLPYGLLAPVYANFMAVWPEIHLELSLGNRNEDVWRHGTDLAIHVDQQDGPKLRQRRSGVIGMVLMVSPVYVAEHGVSTHSHELQARRLLVSSPPSTWRFTSPDGGGAIELQPHRRCDLDGIELGMTLVEAGLGLLHCPHTLCHQTLEAGRLVRLLLGWRTPQRPIYTVWPQQRLPRKVRALLGYLTAFTATMPLLQADPPAGMSGAA